MRTITPKELLGDSGLRPQGPVPWGTPIMATGPGVYLVEWPATIVVAPVSKPAIERWLDMVPALRMDKACPTPADLARRIASFWVPHQTIAYIGQTGDPIGTRLRAFFRSPLGARSPHSGGMWLKALESFDQARVWWAQSPDPVEQEQNLMLQFAAIVRETPFPFANLEVWSRTGSSGLRRTRKLHGLTRQRTPR